MAYHRQTSLTSAPAPCLLLGDSYLLLLPVNDTSLKPQYFGVHLGWAQVRVPCDCTKPIPDFSSSSDLGQSRRVTKVS
jgi:hypothetical protein